MRFHTDVLRGSDIDWAITITGLAAEGVFLASCRSRGSRSRERAYEVRLAADSGKDRFGTARRPRNSGHFGPDGGYGKAATYAEHGLWMAHLFALDPNLKLAGAYDGREDFHAKTRYRFTAGGQVPGLTY